MKSTLRATQFSEFGERLQGKVRDIYVQPHRVLLVSTDRHSSFDRVIAYVPGKGEVLNRLSAFWFDNTRDIVPNQMIDVPDPNVTIAKKCKPLPIEAVMRGYLSGVTSTSLWTRYDKGERDFGAFRLPDGMRKNEKLREPVFTPSTKEQEHDRNVTQQEIVELGLLSKDMVERVEDVSRKLFLRGQELALQRGLILVDTKYEFGLDENGALILIDEVHTPDSSRYWYADDYEARLARGEEPRALDKEYVRRWLVSEHGYRGEGPPPALEAEVRIEAARRYIAAYELLTGLTFVPDTEEPVGRIKRNLGIT